MIQEHMDKMSAQMGKIKTTTDPQERHKLMGEYMATMLNGMKVLKSLPGCKTMSEKKGMMGMEDMMKCHKMMERKNAMMQSMIEGLIESSQIMLQIKR